MSLTIGSGPLSDESDGHLNAKLPDRVVFDQPLGRRLRAFRHGIPVVDTDRARLVHRSGGLPQYAIPAADTTAPGHEDSDLPGYVHLGFDTMDAWFEEDERVHVHPKDPYHRVDAFATSRHVTATIGDTVLADTTRAVALYETGLPPRYYVPVADVDLRYLRPSVTTTECPYKGTARHWHAEVAGHLHADVAWSYDDDVHPEGQAVRNLFCFYDTRAEVTVEPAPG